jgi:hypothetical protein
LGSVKVFADSALLAEGDRINPSNSMMRFSLQDPDLFRRQAYIGGRWCDADNGATLEVNNPATGEVLGTVPMMGATETRRAIDAAKKRLGRLASQACQRPKRSSAPVV